MILQKCFRIVPAILATLLCVLLAPSMVLADATPVPDIRPRFQALANGEPAVTVVSFNQTFVTDARYQFQVNFELSIPSGTPAGTQFSLQMVPGEIASITASGTIQVLEPGVDPAVALVVATAVWDPALPGFVFTTTDYAETRTDVTGNGYFTAAYVNPFNTPDGPGGTMATTNFVASGTGPLSATQEVGVIIPWGGDGHKDGVWYGEMELFIWQIVFDHQQPIGSTVLVHETLLPDSGLVFYCDTVLTDDFTSAVITSCSDFAMEVEVTITGNPGPGIPQTLRVGTTRTLSLPEYTNCTTVTQEDNWPQFTQNRIIEGPWCYTLPNPYGATGEGDPLPTPSPSPSPTTTTPAETPTSTTPAETPTATIPAETPTATTPAGSPSPATPGATSPATVDPVSTTTPVVGLPETGNNSRSTASAVIAALLAASILMSAAIGIRIRQREQASYAHQDQPNSGKRPD